MAKPKIGYKGNISQWASIACGLISVFLAIALTSRNSTLISPFGHGFRRCQRAQDIYNYSGTLEDCCCDFETVNRVHEEVLRPQLEELVKTPFFRYFKVKLWSDCPFWSDYGTCRFRVCNEFECPENEFPEPFKKPFSRCLPSGKLVHKGGTLQAALDRELDTKPFRGWTEVDNPWTNDYDETEQAEMTYVNLPLKPENYTGYTVPSARRIWEAIYAENCDPAGEIEKRILYKLISGVHSSTSSHIAVDYPLDEATGLCGQNITLMYDRVLRYPDRVRNLYFTFLFILRSVIKVADYLEQAKYETGNPLEDQKTYSMMRQLLHNPSLGAACPLPLEEVKLWKEQSGSGLKQQIQSQFNNIRFCCKSFPIVLLMLFQVKEGPNQ